jgi:hypothetical protein
MEQGNHYKKKLSSQQQQETKATIQQAAYLSSTRTMQKGTLMSFEEDSPTPFALSKNTSFDSSFVSMTKFIETTNTESTDGHKIIHPQLISKLNKPAYVSVLEYVYSIPTNELSPFFYG